MSNESEVEVTTTENSNEETEVDTEVVVPEKPPIVETAEAKMARLTRQLRKVKQQLGIEEETEVKKEVKPFTLDRGDKAFLIANGIKGADEFELVSDFARNTGKDIEELVDNKYFNSELQSLRQSRESKLASDAASGSPRGNNSAQGTVEYWIGKGKLPPTYMTQLRRDVVNARLKSAKDGSRFTDNSLIT